MYKGTNDGIEITKRFFEALDMLKANKTIRGMQTFTRQHGINYWNLSTLRKEPENRILKPEYIAYLVHDYAISSDWILLGIGPMFRQFEF